MRKNWLIGASIVLPLLIVIGFASKTTKHRQNLVPSELEIERKYREVDPSVFDSGIALKNGLVKKIFMVSPSLLHPANRPHDIKDPFAEKSAPITARKKSLQSQFEGAGVTFGKGASITYNLKSGALVVINTRDQLDLIEAYGCSGGYRETQIAIRAEIYELPAHLALDVIESAASEGNHKAERDAIRKEINQNSIRLVNALTIISRSGQRSRIEDSYDFALNTQKKESANPEEANDDSEGTERRQIGTLLEVDPVIGADNRTIDLILTLEHHTSDPQIPAADSNMPPSFHAKQIITSLTLVDNSYILAGSWKPTGKLVYEENDLMHLLFITASLQRPTGFVEVMENVAGEPN